MTTRSFIHDDFLLHTEAARRLFHEFARRQPIIDYHCHLSPELVATDHRFSSITELWLDCDHYKWRAMRANGIEERCCTGEASDWEKFAAWARTVPMTLRNPLYHWTHLELAFPFGIQSPLLDEHSAAQIYAACNERLGEPAFTAQGLLRQFDVRVVCTTDDPVDSLAHHIAHARNRDGGVRLLPTFRPDGAIAVEDPARYVAWLDRLAESSGRDITRFGDLMDALELRHAFFHANGCRLSDHGLATFPADPGDPSEIEATFEALRVGHGVDVVRAQRFAAAVLLELSRWDHARGWVQQFHVGALRDTNRRRLAELGPNTGFDSIGDEPVASSMARFLDRLDSTDQLAKTILYNLNPRDNEVYAAMIGNFQDARIPGKMQYGSAWWFLDQANGIERQLEALSNLGLLSRFVGMLTDSRSFLSYSRHEYFRRVLCNLLGSDVERGLLPSDYSLLGRLVENVCYLNAKRYFAFDE